MKIYDFFSPVYKQLIENIFTYVHVSMVNLYLNLNLIQIKNLKKKINL